MDYAAVFARVLGFSHVANGEKLMSSLASHYESLSRSRFKLSYEGTEQMSKIEKTLQRLGQTFTAQDIMVAVNSLTTANSEKGARKKLQAKRNLDMIPIVQGGSLSSYLERGSYWSARIRREDVISENTEILAVVDLLQMRKFLFVGNTTEVKGLIHFSDLNNHLVRMPFSIIVFAFEEHLIREIRPLVDARNLPLILGPDRFSTVEKKMQDLRKNRADLDWVNVLSFEGIARCASHFRKMQISPEEIRAVSIVRNRLAHASEPLIRRHGDVKRLSDTRKICMSVL